MLAYTQDVGTELNEVYLQYSFIGAVTKFGRKYD